MAVSTRFGAGAFAITLLLAACGDSGGGGAAPDNEKDAGGNSDTPPKDAGGGQATDPGIEFAKLDDNTAGAFCNTGTDCKGTGAYCFDTACTGVCETDKDCGKGGSCVRPFDGQPGVCGKVCSQNSDCDMKQDCRSGIDFDAITDGLTDAGIMTFDAGIAVSNVPKTCGASLGVVELADGVVGKPCTSDTTCAPGECARAVNGLEALPNGYCSGKCLADKDCGAGGVCYKDPITAFFGVEGRCLLGCSTGSSCRDGLVCRTSMFIDSKTYCLAPPANNASDAGVSTDQ